MKRLVALAVLLAATRPIAAQGVAPDAAVLEWFSGCWELRIGARVVHEHWMAPAGGVMLGMSRTLRDTTLRAWEFVYLGPVDGRLAYVARPSGQTGATFPATVATDTLAVFEQAAHDFPQRIVYRRRGGDSLLASIEGPSEGRNVKLDYPYRRVACPGA